jgi:hypothetical protein
MKNNFITVLSAILFPAFSTGLIAQPDTSYSFIVAGHAYGAHAGENIGLHPPFLAKLNQDMPPGTLAIILTGDIVNQSTPESWAQVETELDATGIPYYYAMGNHDANATGYSVFNDKFGGTYYAFSSQSELFIVLNSTEDDRSIAPGQLVFLQEQLATLGDTIQNVFIFFHEVLWNSLEKYIGVKSNSRSRYDQIVNYSNYWEEVHPVLRSYPEKLFYVISGDVGGNPDAIACFYDQWNNVTLLSSGMGEVTDENYLLVDVVSTDSIRFTLVPLNEGIDMEEIGYYSVPSATGTIEGPDLVTPGINSVGYGVEEVFNATSYIWNIPEGASGESESNAILLDFSESYSGGTLSVSAFREGFGSGPASSLSIVADIEKTDVYTTDNALQFDILKENGEMRLRIFATENSVLTLRVFNSAGSLLNTRTFSVPAKYSEIVLHRGELAEGILLIALSDDHQLAVRKIIF